MNFVGNNNIVIVAVRVVNITIVVIVVDVVTVVCGIVIVGVVAAGSGIVVVAVVVVVAAGVVVVIVASICVLPFLPSLRLFHQKFHPQISYILLLPYYTTRRYPPAPFQKSKPPFRMPRHT